jgi:hypothetical protein
VSFIVVPSAIDKRTEYWAEAEGWMIGMLVEDLRTNGTGERVWADVAE